MFKLQMPRMKIILISLVFAIIVLPFAGAAATVSTPCCPNIFRTPYYYPVYDYYGNQIWPPEGEDFDPYYMFPTYCSCPFLDNALNRTWYYNNYNFPDIIITPTSISSSPVSSTCIGCSGVSQSVTYISQTTNFPSQSQMIASITKSTGYTPKIPTVF